MIVAMDRRELAQRRKRIGRKAIATVRVAITIDRKIGTATSSKKRFQFRYEFRKWHAFAAAGFVVLLVVGIFAVNIVKAQIATQKAAEDARLQKIEEQKAEAREECRSKIVTEKASQLGTITYDQLYGDQCQ